VHEETNPVPASTTARIVKGLVAAACLVGFAGAHLALAQPAKKGRAKPPPKKEVLACRLGTEERHARIAIELVNGKVDTFAYYSIWKPRTCSVAVQRGDAFSKWEDFGSVTTVTMVDDKGAVAIDHAPGRYKFLFRDIDRMRFCGAEGRITGSLTVTRGRAQCELEGVMDDDPTLPQASHKSDGKPEGPWPDGAKP